MRPCALGVVVTPKDEVLLVKRRDVPVWVLPGGGIDEGESAEEACIREVEEEAGVRVKIVRHAAHYTPRNALTKATDLFICQWDSGSLTPSTETEEVAFFSKNHLPDSLFSLHRIWLQEVLTEPFISRPITEVTYGWCLKFSLTHPLMTLRFLWTRVKVAFGYE